MSMNNTRIPLGNMFTPLTVDPLYNGHIVASILTKRSRQKHTHFEDIKLNTWLQKTSVVLCSLCRGGHLTGFNLLINHCNIPMAIMWL